MYILAKVYKTRKFTYWCMCVAHTCVVVFGVPVVLWPTGGSSPEPVTENGKKSSLCPRNFPLLYDKELVPCDRWDLSRL